MIDDLHTINDDLEYLEAIKTDMKNYMFDNMTFEEDDDQDPADVLSGVITIRRDVLQQWLKEKAAVLSELVQGEPDQEIEALHFVLSERLRRFSYIAASQIKGDERPVKVIMDQYYRILRERLDDIKIDQNTKKRITW